MKTKIIFGIIAIFAAVCGVYYYMSYHYGVKDYTTAKPDFSLTSSMLKSEFAANEKAATTKYSNKAVVVSGTVKENSDLIISFDGVSCKMLVPDKTAKAGQSAKIEGRLVGYDSLIEEVQLDQCSVVNK